jgi:hypothetical protein
MSNHSGEIDPQMQAKLDAMFEKVIEPYREVLEQQMRDQAQEMGLGKTGEVPDGQLTDHDQGELKMGIAMVDGRIVMNFGQPVAWVGFQAEQARAVAAALVTKAEEAEAWLVELAKFKETQSDG